MSTKKTKKCFVIDPSSVACRNLLTACLELESFRRECQKYDDVPPRRVYRHMSELIKLESIALKAFYDRCMEDSKDED